MLIYNDFESGRELFLKTRLELFNKGKGDYDKKQFLADPEVRTQFEEQKDEIIKILQGTDFFHGTGAKHYPEKYNGTSIEIKDSLSAFLTEGLIPQYDLFNKNWTKAERSLSFTQLQVYARLYASCFLSEGENLAYEYGSRAFWIRLLLTRMAVNAVTDPLYVKTVAKKKLKRWSGDPDALQEKQELGKDSRFWTRSFRNDDKFIGGLGAFRALEKAKSTIPGNFPVIIGFNNKDINLLPIKYKTISMYEQRTDSIIPPQNFTHIQVPLSNLAQVKKRVQDLGLQVQVIPIEFVELVNSDSSIQQLSRSYSGLKSK
ncbi:hypothetical protein KBB06_03075 [Candidatus Gracilibacteria bacterium]|nr:hypothetical protein [Candidatus Gracilibacteria bacterium]